MREFQFNGTNVLYIFAEKMAFLYIYEFETEIIIRDIPMDLTY